MTRNIEILNKITQAIEEEAGVEVYDIETSFSTIEEDCCKFSISFHLKHNKEEVFEEDEDIEEEVAIDEKAELPEAVCVEEPQADCNYVEEPIECKEVPVEDYSKKKRICKKVCRNCIHFVRSRDFCQLHSKESKSYENCDSFEEA